MEAARNGSLAFVIETNYPLHRTFLSGPPPPPVDNQEIYALSFLGRAAVLALAQAAPPSPEARLANLEAAVKSAQSAGDNAWMLVSAALVLMMTGFGTP